MAEDAEAGWRRMFEGAVAGLAMIREAVESLGPAASLESREAVLEKRDPEPIHDAEAIVDALARVQKRLATLKP